MPPQKHATLSPSAAERWIQCPASVRMIQEHPVEEKESAFAREGTAAHALAEIGAGLQFGLISQDQYDARMAYWEEEFAEFRDSFPEMREHVSGYLRFLQERKDQHHHAQVLLEQRMDTGVPECYGTSDAVIVSPTSVEIVDLKYGQGVPVDATGNPQLRLYGCGALETFDGMLGDIETVTMSVYQPRLRSRSSETMTARELRSWRQSVIRVAREALGPGASFGPSEVACRWCPVAGRCRAQVEHATVEDFGLPDVLTPEEISEKLSRLPEVKQWVAQLEKVALNMAYSEQTPIPGWKVVLSGGRRTIPDQEGALNHLIENGYMASEVSDRKLKTLGALEKVVKNFNAVMADYVVKTEGSPALVPESDRRPAISPSTEAQKEFLEVGE